MYSAVVGRYCFLPLRSIRFSDFGVCTDRTHLNGISHIYFLAITCSPVYTNSTITDGSVVCNDTNNYNSVCLFSCEDGFKVNGSSNLTCTKSGWSGSEPTCASKYNVNVNKSLYVMFGSQFPCFCIVLVIYLHQRLS